jgi:serine/threonine protein kinase
LPPNLERLAYDYRYAAPESFQMKHSLGPQADYYSLGCVAYELLCGEPPFTSDHPFHLAHFHREKSITAPSRLRETLPPESDNLLLALLDKNPDHRPGTVGEVMQLLDHLAECILSPAQRDLSAITILDSGKRSAIPADSTRIVMPSPAEVDVDHTYIGRTPTPPSPREGPAGAVELPQDGPTGTDWSRVIGPGHPPEKTDRFGEGTNPLSDVDTTREILHSPGAETIKGVGDVLNDRFVLEERLGEGGMSTVYKAVDRRKLEADDRYPYVAVKVLNMEFRAHPDSLIALQREAKKSQSLAHPNIVRVYDFDRDGSTVYMTMEYLTGRSLAQILRAPDFKGMPQEEALRVLEGMAGALRFAHDNGIVHSDFKPGNIFLTDTGEVKVIDFGIARAFRRPEQVDMEMTRFDAGSLGALTPTYASAQMLEGQEVDPRDDIYALACIAYEMLTGRHPFGRMQATEARDGGLEVERRKNLSRRQWKALKSALNFDREHRTPSVEQFMADLGDHEPKAGWFSRILGFR